MKARVKIKKIGSEQVKTKYGPKEKLNILVDTEKGKELWVSGFSSPGSSGWAEGDVVEMEVWSREYNGKTYWNFKAPRLEHMVLEELREIKAMLQGKTSGGVQDELPPPHEDSDFNPETDSGEETDVPF